MTMPKIGSLSADEKRLLWNWIQLGAPKENNGGSTQPPTEEPLTATFASIDKHIFQEKCVACHSAGGQAKRILLDKQSLMDSPLELVLPGNSDESGLVIAVERTDDRRMPLAEAGYSELSVEEKAASRHWIDNGALD